MTSVLGRRVTRSDAEAKVRGSADYGVDVVLPGMVYGALWRSPVPAARVVAIDSEAAWRVPGVLALITGADVDNHPTGLALCDQPLFGWPVVRYEGEPVAAVAAETPESLEKALDLLHVEFVERPAITDVTSALSPDAVLVHPDWASYASPSGAEWPREGNVVCELLSDPGGVGEVFSSAAHVVRDVYRADRQYQAYLEPHAAVAEYNSGRFTLHVAHQFPFNVRDRVAHALGVGASAVRVVGHHIGGGFGAKLDVALEPYAALLARATGRPVRMENSRSEDLMTAQCRESAVVTISSALSASGDMLGCEFDVVFDSGAYAIDAPYLASIPMFAVGSVYRVDRTRVRCRAVYTNTAPTGAFRGVSGTYLVFAVERHLDHVARELGLDRRELRLRHLRRNGEKMLNGQTLADADILRECFDRAEEVAPFSSLGKGPYRGVGMAACVWLTNPLAGSAVLKLNEDGTIGLVTGATDNGSGAVTMGLRQIAAEEFGIGASDVLVTMPDTDVAGYDAGSQGSRTTRVVGMAVIAAAAQVRERVLSIASDHFEAAAADLEVVDGGVQVRGVPSRRLTLAEVAKLAASNGGPITGAGSYSTPLPNYSPTCATGFLFPAFPTPTYHLHVAEVEVEPLVGTVRVLRYIVVQEVGRVVNPTGVVGQIQGGVAQGLGYALWEWLESEGGRYRQRTFESYGLPLSVDVPRVEVVTLEHGDSDSPHGAKGVGEPPIVPVAAAVANAVSDAIGAEVDAIPIRPEAILEALGPLGASEHRE